MKHHGWERSLVLHVVHRPEPGVVRPEEVDVVRQHCEVQWDGLQYQRNSQAEIYVKLRLNVSQRKKAPRLFVLSSSIKKNSILLKCHPNNDRVMTPLFRPDLIEGFVLVYFDVIRRM